MQFRSWFSGRQIRAALTLLKVAVTALALWLVLAYYDVDRLRQIIAQGDPFWLAIAAGMLMILLLQMTWRWQLISFVVIGLRPRFRALLVAQARSQIYSLPLPSVVGADAIRVALLARQTGVAAAVRSVVCDRLIGLFALFTVVAAMLPLFALRIENGPAFASIALASLSGLAAFILLMFGPSAFRHIPAIGQFAAATSGDLRLAVTARGGRIVSQALLTHFLSAVVFAALARSVGAQIPLIDSLLIILPATLVASLPISLGGWGVREATIAAAFSFIGADPAQGTAASILFGLIFPLGGIVIECINLPMRPIPTSSPHDGTAER